MSSVHTLSIFLFFASISLVSSYLAATHAQLARSTVEFLENIPQYGSQISAIKAHIDKLADGAVWEGM